MALQPRQWPPELTTAAALLLRAAALAEVHQRQIWDFAVHITELCQLGLTHGDLRSLVCWGFLDHAEEISVWPATERSFQPTAKLTFGCRTCFVLTEEGRAAAAARLEHAVPTAGDPPWLTHHLSSGPIHANGASLGPQPFDSLAPPENGNGASSRLDTHSHVAKPLWNPKQRCLFLGELIVKKYGRPAPNQWLILAAFQEEDWPARIDDPLPPAHGRPPQRRLHEAIAGLNRKQTNAILRFSADGTGQGVLWLAVDAFKGGIGAPVSADG